MWAVIAIVVVWIVIASVAGRLTSAVVGFAVFFSPLAGGITYAISNSGWFALFAGLVLIGIASDKHQSDKEKERKAEAERRRELRELAEKRKLEEERKAEIQIAARYISRMDDNEAKYLYRDYEKYYLDEKMFDDVKTNFENRIIEKARPIREAEELRLAEEEAKQEAIEEEKWEEEQNLLTKRYGNNGAEQ